VHLITYSHTDFATAAFPVRSLSQGPDYRPDWRWQTCERYLVQVSSSKDKEAEVDYILARERDPYVRQLLAFHYRRHCVISPAIEYALRCGATNIENRIASLIRAMTICDLPAESIARELGTVPLHIVAYQKFFFDVKRFLDRKLWIKRICFPVYQHQPSAEEECEARWLAVAYMRGWGGLSGLVSNQRLAHNSGEDLQGLVRVLLGRSLDYFVGLEAVGIPPSERDLELLALVQRRMEGLGLPLKLEDLTYVEALDPEREKRNNEAKQIVRGLSPQARRKIAALLERCKYEAEESAEDNNAMKCKQ